ncbi:response regulator [Psychroserpens ponticola]|uniref:Response regulator transcription factor n=1 Tax=Psychroserpens ponticola TaxID=2932268 RepID=A0ABY7RZX9_9FLAO|nr:response regulator transcription factor [Psychroserpens ponticola]WCO02637.1 response regulator transcription factor [Psychroserpens ponticola]
MQNINIVLVDDHKMFLEGISSVLQKQSHINIKGVFDSAILAIEFIETNDVDLLITDISMPEINGLELIKAVKKNKPDLKILVISMFKQIQSFNNINGYLLKETSHEILLKAITTIVIEEKSYYYKDFVKRTDELEFKKHLLTKREKEIIKLIANEYSTDEIAKQLFLSKHTVEAHKKNIFLKLQVHNAAGLVKKAAYLGYL